MRLRAKNALVIIVEVRSCRDCYFVELLANDDVGIIPTGRVQEPETV